MSHSLLHHFFILKQLLLYHQLISFQLFQQVPLPHHLLLSCVISITGSCATTAGGNHGASWNDGVVVDCLALRVHVILFLATVNTWLAQYLTLIHFKFLNATWGQICAQNCRVRGFGIRPSLLIFTHWQQRWLVYILSRCRHTSFGFWSSWWRLLHRLQRVPVLSITRLCSHRGACFPIFVKIMWIWGIWIVRWYPHVWHIALRFWFCTLDSKFCGPLAPILCWILPWSDRCIVMIKWLQVASRTTQPAMVSRCSITSPSILWGPTTHYLRQRIRYNIRFDFLGPVGSTLHGHKLLIPISFWMLAYCFIIQVFKRRLSHLILCRNERNICLSCIVLHILLIWVILSYLVFNKMNLNF